MECKVCGHTHTKTTPLITNVPEEWKHLSWIKKAQGRCLVTCTKCHQTWSVKKQSSSDNSGIISSIMCATLRGCVELI
jgi:hypothetical protein